MSRLKPVNLKDFSPEELEIYKIITATKHNPRGPRAIVSRHPILAEYATKFGEFLRSKATISKKLQELAMLTTARCLNSQNVWNSHRPLAEKAGLSPAVIDAIAQRTQPPFVDEHEEVVFMIAKALMETHDIDDALYSRGIKLFGEKRLIEIVATVGHYFELSLLISSFREQLPDGVSPPLPK